LDTVGDMKGLEVYPPAGIFVGVVDEVVIDVSKMSVNGLYIADANPSLVDENVAINIPFRWIQSIGDIIILNRFPNERITSGSAR